MAAFPSQEHRPLKKPRTGHVGPDVYPQDPKQREDELTLPAVKNGFTYRCAIEDEFGTARKETLELSEDKLVQCFKSILAKKTEANTFQETGSAKKKQQLNTKDHFWPVTQRTKPALEAWFRDLAGNKVLTSLAKKVPNFNKKEEIFSHLIEYQVPMQRAVWLIKMSSAYQVAMSEARNRNRQKIDPSMDWAQAICKFLKDQLNKFIEYYQGSPTTTTSFLTATNTNTVDIDAITKNWTYGTQLGRSLYEENLLDRQEFLNWLVELLEKLKITDDGVLRRVMHQILMYMSEFVQSQLLSRRLAYWCARRISQMINDMSGTLSPRTQSPMVTNGPNGTLTTASTNQSPVSNPLLAISNDQSGCPQHRALLLDMCSIIHTIVLRCTGALVWHHFGEGRHNPMLCGSPLDLLPVPSSSLPMSHGHDNQIIRAHLRVKEHQIRVRSRAVEVRWSSDKCQQSAAGFTISRVLNILEILDKHNFEKVESGSSLDTLYTKIFSATQSKENNEPPLSDEPILNVLCEWAVSTQRTGEHRAVVVARLIEKRQSEVAAEKLGDSEMLDEESMGSDVLGTGGLQPFQNLLMNFLDTKAPVLDYNPTVENKLAFANLVLLFCELIRYDVFSHDVYMCSLVSRGDLTGSPALVASAALNADLSSVKSDFNKHDPMEIENPGLDSDFDIFPFKDETGRPSPDQPASVKSERSVATPAQAHTPGMGHSTPAQAHTPGNAHTPGSHTPGAAHTPSGGHTPGMAHTPGFAHTPGVAHTPGFAHTPSSVPHSSSHHHTDHSTPKRPSKHLVYATHFPIPQDEAYVHEANQRMIALYGVGKAREDARHMTKRITKEIMKLYNKKNSLDVSSGDVGKKGKKKEKEKDESTSFEGIFNKFQKLSYYDQHAVTCSCMANVLDQVQNFASGSSQHQHLPLIDNIVYLFDLMEYSYNVNVLLDFVISLLKELPEVETVLVNKQSNLAGSYTTQLSLCIVAVLRKYHAYLLISQEQTMAAFEGLKQVVKHVTAPSDCTSSERCILAYLYDLYTVCCFIRAKYSESFGGTITKIMNALHGGITPSASNLLWEPWTLMELVENPKSRPDALLVKQLKESSQNRYSFVCNVLLQIYNCQNMDKLNEISILCAELTASCNALSSEWLGVLKALCCSSNHSSGFIDVLTQVDVSDLSIHDSLAVFTGILIARNCFSLEDLVCHVALHSLLAACPSSTGGDQDAEQGARLACHLLLRLFCSSHTQLGPVPIHNKNSCNIKSSTDRHLLAAAHHSIKVGAVVAVLKGILMLGDSCNNETKNRAATSPSKNNDIIHTLMNSLEDCEDDLDMNTGFVLGPTSTTKGGMDSAGLSEYAKHALREICSQEWVRERFLKNPEELFTADMLLENMLKRKQAQQLVQMICYPGGLPSSPEPDDEDEDDDEEDGDGEPAEQVEQRRTITRILKNMDQWSLRVSWLELQLMIKQASSSEMNVLLDNIAKGTIEVFQKQTEIDKENAGTPPSWDVHRPELYKEGVWLVAPLIAKLPTSVQGRVLKAAGQVLETGNNFWSTKSKEKERVLLRSISLLGLQPFLSLVLTCLRGQDEQREGLLNSLHSQLDKFVTNAKEPDKGLPEDGKLMGMMQEALQLRLSLVGSMFDTIQRSTPLTSDWAVLLLQLMCHGVVDSTSNGELFTTVLDMLSVLTHGTLVTENSDRWEENKRFYLNLIKKLKTCLQREMGDKKSDSIDELRQLLPLPKRQVEVVCVEPSTESKSHKADSDKIKEPSEEKEDEKDLDITAGLQTANKVKIVAWDLLEGHKNPAPLSWVWFGAVRLERKPLKYEEQLRLLLYHTHSVVKPGSYYLEPPPLPPEDLEPPPPKEEEKPPEPIQEVVKPENNTRKKKPARKRPARTNPPQNYIPSPTSTAASLSPGTQAPMGPMFGQDQMFRSQPGNWYPNQSPQQSQFYQQIPPGGPRYPQQMGTKQAIRGMLSARQPPYGGHQPSLQQHLSRLPKYQQQQLIRQRLSSMHHGGNMMARIGDGGNMGYSQGPHGPFPGPQHPQHMGMQPGMSQGSYSGFSGMQPQGSEMMDTGNPAMMSGGQFQQPGGYHGNQPMAPMSMPGQGNYMGQQQQPMQQHFPNTSQPTPASQQAAPYQTTAQPQSGPQPPQRQFSNPGSTQQFNNISGGSMQPQMGSGPMAGQIGQMGSMSGYNQLGPQGAPQGGQPQQPGYNIQGMNPQLQQQLQQRQQQQQMMMRQQQQQQQQQQQIGQPQSQQQTAAMVALQRQQSQPPQYPSQYQPPQYQ